ncbi:MAG: hypothetical protein U9Q70_05400 [Chloroflexota bacterium]|nr:hypothetical protein [Chloroflexota bacterium]
MTLEAIGLFVGAIVTLIIFSYLMGDNPLYRWVLALVVGSGAGYALAITLNFLYHWGIKSINGELLPVVALPPLVLGILLLFKGFPKLSRWGELPMGFILGIGAAVAISGAVWGTILPQLLATADSFVATSDGSAFLEGFFILIGVLFSLLTFSPRAFGTHPRSSLLARLARRLGRAFVTIALAVAFVGALTSALTLFIERWWMIVDAVFRLSTFFGG